MRAPWIYGLGSNMCLMMAAAAIAIDTHYSLLGIMGGIGINYFIALTLSLIIATISTSLGAMFSHAESVALAFGYTIERVAKTRNRKERILRLIGLCFASTFLTLTVLGTYAVNLWSNYSAIRPQTPLWWVAFGASGLICFSSDACLVLSLNQHLMALKSKEYLAELKRDRSM